MASRDTDYCLEHMRGKKPWMSRSNDQRGRRRSSRHEDSYMNAFSPSVLFALTWLAVFCLVQQTSACTWQVEVRGDLAKEATYFHPDDTSPLHIRLHNPQESISVLCILTKLKEKMNGDHTKYSVVETTCLYPDGQFMQSKAVAVIDTETGNNVIMPLHLQFSRLNKTKKATGYSITINCKAN